MVARDRGTRLKGGKDGLAGPLIGTVVGGTLLADGAGGYLGTMPRVLVLILIATMQPPEFARQIAYGLILLLLLSLYGR